MNYSNTIKKASLLTVAYFSISAPTPAANDIAEMTGNMIPNQYACPTDTYARHESECLPKQVQRLFLDNE